MKTDDSPPFIRGSDGKPESRFRLGRRMVGNVTLLLAIFGLILCLGGIAGAWVVKGRVDAVGEAVFGTADESLTFVQEKLERAKRGLERSRQPAGELSRIAARVKSTEADVRQEYEPLLKSMDSAWQNLQLAESWLDSAQALASNVSRASASLVSSDFATSRQESTGLAVALEVQAFAHSVTDALSQLQSMREELIKLRNSGVLAREAVLTLIDRVTVLDQAVERLGSRLGNVEAKAAAAQINCAEQGRRFRQWTLLATLAASVLPVWFGLSQIIVMAHGWRMAHPICQA